MATLDSIIEKSNMINFSGEEIRQCVYNELISLRSVVLSSGVDSEYLTDLNTRLMSVLSTIRTIRDDIKNKYDETIDTLQSTTEKLEAYNESKGWT